MFEKETNSLNVATHLLRDSKLFEVRKSINRPLSRIMVSSLPTFVTGLGWVH